MAQTGDRRQMEPTMNEIIENEFKVDVSTINRLLSGKTWKQRLLRVAEGGMIRAQQAK